MAEAFPPFEGAAMEDDARGQRKDSLHESPNKRRKTLAITRSQAPDPKAAKPSRPHVRNEPRHIYVCAYYDDLLTPNDDDERKRRACLAFRWDLLVRRESLEASGTHFFLATRHVRPRGRAIEGLDWEFRVSRWAHADSRMILCMRIGTARYRHAGVLGDNDLGEDDEDEIEELCKRTELEADTTPWEWVTTVMERLWQNGIIWRHIVYRIDHEMFLALRLDLEESYQAWKAGAGQMRRRKPVHAVYPNLDELSCDEEALQDAACGVCHRPQYGFRTRADVRWLFPSEQCALAQVDR